MSDTAPLQFANVSLTESHELELAVDDVDGAEQSKIPSLQSIALRSIISGLQTAKILPNLDILRYLDTLELQAHRLATVRNDYEQLKEKITKPMVDIFPVYLAKYGEDQLREALEPDLFQKLMDYVKELEASKKLMAHYRSGSILEAPKAPEDKYQPSSEGYFCPEVLYQGVKWPAAIDVGNREKYLSPEDFERVFGMTKEQFQQEPRYRRIEIKKEKRMF